MTIRAGDLLSAVYTTYIELDRHGTWNSVWAWDPERGHVVFIYLAQMFVGNIRAYLVLTSHGQVATVARSDLKIDET